ncbi:DUF982 domain-containing protein [Nitrospirillum amazonense]|uniref:DUF982 domain-containing protein n=1 Tax=Nitrospirillum amazonense TaxID=28077 RepID=UPI003BB03425
MMTRHWFKAAPIWETPAISRRVTSVEEALRCLMELWPDEHRASATYEAAIDACEEAISAAGTVEVARDAFVAAADEAGILDDRGAPS